MNVNIPLQTPRLTLRRFTVDDLEAFQAYRSDPELARYQGWQAVSDAEAIAFLSAQSRQRIGAEGEWLQLAVTRRDTCALIGDIGLCVVNEAVGVIEIGFTVSRPSQGQGYATEAVTAVVGALLASGRVRSIVAVVDTRNVASVALLERVGFELERTDAAIYRGEPCREHTFVFAAARGSGGPSR